MPNLLYTYVLDICMICKRILLIKFLKEPKLILLHTVKWFQVLLSITNNSFKHPSICSHRVKYLNSSISKNSILHVIC